MKNTWFFTCSSASITFVAKNIVALQKLKVNCFLAENRQNVNSSWHCLQKHFSLVCWSGYLSITVNQKHWTSAPSLTNKKQQLTKLFVALFQRTSKNYAVLDSWKLKMFQRIISRSDLGFYQICKEFYT